MWLDGKDLNISPTRLRSERFSIGFLPGARCPRKDYAGDAAEDSSNPKPSTAKYRSSSGARRLRRADGGCRGHRHPALEHDPVALRPARDDAREASDPGAVPGAPPRD